MTSLHHNHNSKMRFMNFIKQPDSPDPNPNSLEFEESDVVWSADTVSISSSQSPPSLSNSPTALHHFNGLSAALSDDHHPLVRRKSALNPLSVATAARNISPKPHDTHGGPRFHQSAPVNVPLWPKKFRANFDEIEEEEEEAEEMVPPHEIVARSHVTFSVFEGVGRTLKGRDLRRVRNAVFQKTGFLD